MGITVNMGSTLTDKQIRYARKIAIRSGAYGILMTLFFAKKQEAQHGLTKDEIGKQSRLYCNRGVERVDHYLVNEVIGNWQPNIRTVETNHKLVQRHKPRECVAAKITFH
jgi:hypothetical protein